HMDIHAIPNHASGYNRKLYAGFILLIPRATLWGMSGLIYGGKGFCFGIWYQLLWKEWHQSHQKKRDTTPQILFIRLVFEVWFWKKKCTPQLYAWA
ncbi:MAG: hypothetical protein M3162_08575, partial [Thermoproteota archaeon]|nr:hypothetical protein [Thermoproteota archaeon]